MKKKILLTSLVTLLLITACVFSACKGRTHRVTFVVEGETSATVTTDADGNVALPTDPRKVGYTFDGWYYDDGSWERPFDATSGKGATVYARFVYGCAHQVSEWTIINPSCLDAGEKSGRCDVCGQFVTEVIPAKGYHTPYVDKAVAPTCTTAGLTEGTHCADCFEVLTKRESVARLNHEYVDEVCVHCGDKYDVMEMALGTNAYLVVTMGFDYHTSRPYNTFVEDERDQPTAGNAYVVFRTGYATGEQAPVARSGGWGTRMCYIGIRTTAEATQEEIEAAQREAGERLRYVFERIEAGEWPTSTSILLQEGITLDVSGREWKTVRSFDGYLGTAGGSEDEAPAVIKGVRVTGSVIYEDAYVELNTKRNLCVSAFIGAVNSTCVYNVRFTELSIEQPLTDEDGFCVAAPFCVCVDMPLAYERTSHFARFWTDHVTVDDSCSIRGVGVVAGLVGYVGGYYQAEGEEYAFKLKSGSVSVVDCQIDATVSSDGTSSYAAAGGLIGSIGLNRLDEDGNGVWEFNGSINVRNCTGTCSVEGQCVGAVIGDVFGNAYIYVRKNDFSAATLTTRSSSDPRGFVGSSVSSVLWDWYATEWDSQEQQAKVITNKRPLDENGNALPLIGRTR